MTVLRPDQQAVLADTRDALRRGKKPCMVAPCGWGKGTTFSHIVHAAAAREKSVLFIINSCEILRDFSRRLDSLNIPHGVIQGNHPRYQPHQRTQVATIQTLHRRERLPKADLILLDEAQFCTAPTFLSVLDRYRGVPIVGASATPLGPGGTGLDCIFDELILGPSTEELISLGLLVPVRAFAPPPPAEAEKVKITAGEYNQRAMAEAYDKPKLVGDCVEHWHKLARGLRTIAFSSGIEHSKHCRDMFISAGVNAIHVDADTPSDVRDAAWEDLATGRITMVWNVGIARYGWDVKQVECCILELRTASLTNFRQMVGRIQRPAPGKTHSILLDHGGNVLLHGRVEDDPDWTIDGAAIRRAKQDNAASFSVRMCTQCWAAYKATQVQCPYCGAAYVGREIKPLGVTDGQLVEITKAAEPKPYVIGKLSANPVFAYFQQQAELKRMDSNKGHRWAYAMSKLFEQGKHSVPGEVMERWKHYRGRVA